MNNMPKNENKLLPLLKEDVIEAGCDEAGRGCLAGRDVWRGADVGAEKIPNHKIPNHKKISNPKLQITKQTTKPFCRKEAQKAQKKQPRITRMNTDNFQTMQFCIRAIRG